MMYRILICCLMMIGLGCQMPAASSSTGHEVKRKIAAKIWHNECAGSVKGLVSWNSGENFPSLGLGHFIWYPRGVEGPFEESFPAFVKYAQARGVAVPSWATGEVPWLTRQAFLQADRSDGLPDQMRRWLAAHTEIQTDFIIRRSIAALHRLKKAADNPQDIVRKYYSVASTPQGMYALIDYVNFKGEGIQPSERYRGEGWGLLQVLEEMRPVNSGAKAAVEFSRAASVVLRRRVANSPASRGEKRWLQGWLNRCATYAKPL